MKLTIIFVGIIYKHDNSMERKKETNKQTKTPQDMSFSVPRNSLAFLGLEDPEDSPFDKKQKTKNKKHPSFK